MKPNKHSKSGIAIQSSPTLSLQLYLTGVFFSVLAFSVNIMDSTLIPRFIVACLSLSIIFLSLKKAKSEEGSQSLNVLHLLYFSFFICNILSALYAINVAEALFESFRVFIGFCIFLLTIYFLRVDSKNETYFLRGVTIISFISILYGIIQLISIKSYTLEELYEVKSTCGHKNLFASLLFLSMMFNLSAYVKDKGPWKTSSGISSLLCLGVIVFLQSRAVWLACIAFFVFLVGLLVLKYGKQLYQWKKTGLIVLIAFVGITLLVIVNGYAAEVWARANVFNFLGSDSGKERLFIWNKTLCFMKGHSLFGVGAGNWQIYFPSCSLEGLWRAETLNVTFQRPHNDYLWIFSETGYLGASLFFSLLLIVLYISVRVCVNYKSEKLSKLIYVGGFIGYLIISFFDFPKERIEHIIYYNTLLGFIVAGHSLNIPLGIIYKVRLHFIKWLFAIILLFGLLLGIYRFKGEYWIKKVHENKANMNWELMIKNSQKANSFFYTIDPTSIPVFWYSGIANFSLQNYDASLDDFLKAYKNNPFDTQVLNNLGSNYEVKGMHEKAKKYYLEAIRINPRFSDPRLNLAVIYYNEGDLKSAYEWALSCPDSSERKTQYLTILREKLQPSK